MKKLIILFTILLTSFTSSALVVSSGKISLSDKWSQVITDHYFPRVYVLVAIMNYEALGCEHGTGVAISLGSDNPQGEIMLNMLLSAKNEGKSVQLAAKSCWGGYSVPLVFSVQVY